MYVCKTNVDFQTEAAPISLNGWKLLRMQRVADRDNRYM